MRRKKVTVGHKLYAGIHFVLCQGPIDSLLKIRAEKKLLWAGQNKGTSISISAPTVFGGDPPHGEGGVVGDVDVEMGYPNQEISPYLKKAIGSIIPAYRSVVSVILEQVYVSASRYIKPWEFLGQRIFLRQAEGLEQWYPEKAGIGEAVVSEGSQWRYLITTVGDATDYSGVSFDDSGWSIGDAPFGSGTYSLSPSPSDNGFSNAPATTVPQNRRVWMRSTVNLSAVPSLFRFECFIDNSARVYVNGNLAVQAGDIVGSFGYNDIYIDSTYFTAGNNTIAVEAWDPHSGAGNFFYFDWRLTAVEQYDMNPAHIIRECLTDPDFGLAFEDSEIDDDSFRYAADLLHSEKMGMSLLWDGQMEIQEFIQEITRHIDASVDIDLSTGKARLKLIRDDYDLGSGYVILGPDEVQRVEDFTQAEWGRQTNAITVVYEDGLTGDKATVTVPDTAAVQRQGKVVATTIQYPGFSSGSIAARAAQRDLRTLKARIRTCTIYATRIAASLRLGDVFVFNWSELGFTDAVMRVEKVDLGDPRSGIVRISAVDDVFALSDESPLGAVTPEWESPAGDAIPTPEHLAVEMPYYEAVQRLGQTSVDAALADNPLIGYLVAAGTRPTQRAHINATITVDAGSGYEESEYVDFSPLAYLISDIAYTDTVFPVADDVDLDLVSVGSFAQIGSEILVVESIDSGSIVFGRGVLDTVPAEYSGSSSLPIIFWDEYGGTDGTEYVDGQTVNVKLLTSTGSDQLASVDAPTDSVTFDQRAYRPYPPGNLKVNSEYFPETIGGLDNLSLTWAHRDRTQQTSASLIDFFDGDVGPESGTSYTVRVYDEDDLLIIEAGGISGNTYTLSEVDEVGGSLVEEPYWGQTVLLLNMNGTNGSTTFTDSSPSAHAVTAGGDAQLATAVAKFGTASGLFDGADDFLSVPNSQDWAFGLGDFTVETWVRSAAGTGGGSNFDKLIFGGFHSPAMVFFLTNDDLRPALWDGTAQRTGTIQVQAETWTHVAWTRENTTLRIFVGGVQCLEVTSHTIDFSPNGPYRIGNSPNDNTRDFDGYLDDFRITKGVARYTEDFNVPSAELGQYIISGGGRRQGRLRFELETARNDSTALTSWQKYDHEIRRPGWNFNWNRYWNGGAP